MLSVNSIALLCREEKQAQILVEKRNKKTERKRILSNVRACASPKQTQLKPSRFLPERDVTTLHSGLCCRKSVCLSSETLANPTK